MTLPGSGSISSDMIKAELRTTGALTFPSSDTRWLCDLPSGSFTLPTNVYNKSGWKMVDNGSAAIGGGTQWVFGTNWGAINSNRTLLYIVAAHSSANVDNRINSILVNGGGITQIGFAVQHDANGSIAQSAYYIQESSSSSVTTTVNFNAGVNSAVMCVIALRNAVYSPGSGFVSWGSSTSLNTSACTVPDNGYLIRVGSKAANGSPSVMSGTGIFDTNFGGGHFRVAMDNRIPSGTYGATITWASANPGILMNFGMG